METISDLRRKLWLCSGPPEEEKLFTNSPGLVSQKDDNGRTLLHDVALHGTGADDSIKAPTLASLLLAHGADANATDGSGKTPLHVAVAPDSPYRPYRDAGVTEVLLRHGADPNAKDNHGQTPLHLVAKSEYGKGIAEMLLAHGAEVNAKDDSGYTAYHYASQTIFRDGGITDFLYESGGRDLGTGIHSVVLDGDLSRVDALLTDNPALVSGRDEKGYAPLGIAALRGFTAIAELLIAHGARVSDGRRGPAPYYDRATPLYFAAAQGRTATVKLLLAHGADVNAGTGGDTPLDALRHLLDMPGCATLIERDREKEALKEFLKSRGARR